jgi:hypothetical protein
MQARLAPKSPIEPERTSQAGHDVTRILTADNMIGGGTAYFAATGITDGTCSAVCITRAVAATPAAWCCAPTTPPSGGWRAPMRSDCGQALDMKPRKLQPFPIMSKVHDELRAGGPKGVT